MKNETAFKVGEQIYYVNIDHDNIFIIMGRIIEVNNYPDGTITYGLTQRSSGFRSNWHCVSEKKIFKKDKKSFIEKLNLIFAEEAK